jgi:hypothetical protein
MTREFVLLLPGKTDWTVNTAGIVVPCIRRLYSDHMKARDFVLISPDGFYCSTALTSSDVEWLELRCSLKSGELAWARPRCSNTETSLAVLPDSPVVSKSQALLHRRSVTGTLSSWLESEEGYSAPLIERMPWMNVETPEKASDKLEGEGSPRGVIDLRMDLSGFSLL